jgi:hypothetical protein
VYRVRSFFAKILQTICSLVTVVRSGTIFEALTANHDVRGKTVERRHDVEHRPGGRERESARALSRRSSAKSRPASASSERPPRPPPAAGNAPERFRSRRRSAVERSESTDFDEASVADLARHFFQRLIASRLQIPIPGFCLAGEFSDSGFCPTRKFSGSGARCFLDSHSSDQA